MKHVCTLWIGLLVLLALFACGPSKAEIATSSAQTQAVIDALASEVAGTEQAVQATQDAEATSVAGTVTQEFNEAATATMEMSMRETEAAEKTATRVASIAASTEMAASMYDQVVELASYGYLSSAGGTYHTLPTFDESWAQINWYQWWRTGYKPRDFVIRADASWDSASDKANWFNSGCGFVFRETGVQNHYLAFLGLDGNVQFMRSVRDVQRNLGYSYSEKLDVPKGNAQIMLVVEDDTFTFFVNGEKVHTRQDFSLTDGELGLTLLSGTNKGYGTRCRMTNIELWILK